MLSNSRFKLIALAFLIGTAIAQQRTYTVVLDAGHGGHDSGALGKHSKEKDAALAITLKTGKILEKHKHIKVIYTRKEDKFVELHRRADIANRHKADLFVSIHCNANENPSVMGTETYVMGLHKTESNLKVAMRENAVILKEENYLENYEGFDPNSPEAYIVFSLYQNAFLEQSIEVAHKVQTNFEEAGRKNRGVKQAGFLVLARTAMPSILVETGFITNEAEEKFLNSEKGQQIIAQAIAQAIIEYFDRLDSLEREAQKNEQRQNRVTEGYWVQIYASREKMDVTRKPFEGIGNIAVQKAGSWYRYLVGPFKTIEEAKKEKERLVQKGFTDAFIRHIKPQDGS